MTFWNPDTIRTAVGGTWLHRPPALELPKDRPADLPPPPPHAMHAPILGVSTDTRTLKAGQVYVALKGPTHDGHGFLLQAVSAGAPVLIVDDATNVPDKGFEPAVGIVKVADTGKALLRLASAYRASLKRTKVIAVCGSNGKTTTTRLIDHVLKPTLRGMASAKSFNNAIGVPLTILSARENDQYLICEVGTNAPGEIVTLAEVVRPDIAVITSIGREHLEGLGDLDGVAREEASVVSYLAPKGVVIATADSPELDEHLKRASNLVTFGVSPSATLRLTSCAQDDSGVSFTVNDRLRVRVPLLGEHNALNAIAALAVARRLNIDEAAAVDALASASGADMRLQVAESGGVMILNDAYNANPDSMIAAVRTLAALRASRGASAKRGVAIVGEMLELGSASGDGHRAVARAIHDLRAIDLVVLVGAGMQAARDELASLGWARERMLWFPDADHERAAQIAGLLREGDVALVKGSRRVKLERVVTAFEITKGKTSEVSGVTPQTHTPLVKSSAAGAGAGGGASSGERGQRERARV